MATVYLAHDLRHDRKVAVKVLRPELAAVIGGERFLAEIRTTANLQHPHILPLHDSGGTDSFLYYVMPFVEGESLRSRLTREKQLPVADAIRIATEVAGALDYAHRHSVIHRDIKPENILLHDGSALVTDFGIALAVSTAGGTRMTETGLSLGTPHYMSPEQATGEREITARSDVYALGAVTYEMLVGEPPFTGPTAQSIVAKVLTEEPRPLLPKRRTIPPEVEAAVLTALQKLPADRFTSATQFAEALHRPGDVTARTVTRARARPRAESVFRWRVVAAIACLIAAGTLGWFLGRPTHRDVGLQLARQLTFDGTVQGAAISPDASWLAYVTADCPVEPQRCRSTLQVREVDGTQSVRLLTWPVLTPDVKWSPDGAAVLFRGSPDSGATTVYLTSRLGGSVRRLGARATAMDFTPDGRAVALAVGHAGHQTLVRYDAASLAPIDSTSLPVGLELLDLEFAPNSDRLAIVATVRGSYRVVGLLESAGRLLDSTAGPPRPVVRWDPRGSALVYFQPGPGIADDFVRLPVHGDRLDPEGRRIILGQVPTGYEGRFDAARNGRIAMVTAPTIHRLSVAQLKGPRRSWVSITTRTGYVFTPAISPDGSRIAAVATDNLGDNLYVFPVDGGAPQAVTAIHAGEKPRWSPDGRYLAYSSHEPIGLAMTDVTGGRPRMVVPNYDVTGGMHDWVANDALVFYRSGAFEIVDTVSRRRAVLTIPDSLGGLVGPIVADAPTTRVAYWSVVARSLVVADLRARGFARLLRSAEPLRPLGWGSDGSLFVGSMTANPFVWANALVRHILRIPRAGGPLLRVLPVTVTCSEVVVGAGGRLAACAGLEVRPDVWLADEAGRSGW